MLLVLTLLNQRKANLGSFGKVDGLLDDDSTTLNATMQKGHWKQDTIPQNAEHAPGASGATTTRG